MLLSGNCRRRPAKPLGMISEPVYSCFGDRVESGGQTLAMGSAAKQLPAGNTPPTRARGVLSLAEAPSLLRRGAASLKAISRALPPRGDLLKALIAGLAYYVGAELAFWVGTLSYFFAPLWPPNMILFCALLQAPYRLWWLYVVAAFPAHIAAETEMGMEALPLLGAFACNAALALCAAAGIRRLSKGPPWLDSLAKAWTFILVGVLGAPTLVASVIAALGWLSDDSIGGVHFGIRWGIANVLGGIALAPILVTWIGEGLGWLTEIPARRAMEAAVLASALISSAYVGFPASSADYPVLACMPIPLMLWAAVRFGPRGASAAIFVVSLMALGGAIQGRAPFAASSPEHTILSLQAFLAMLSAPFLVLAAVVVDRQRATAEVTLAQKELQSILDNTPDCIYVKDLQGRYFFANRSARTVVGRELVGRTAGELFAPHLTATWSAEDKLVIANGKPIIKEEQVDRGAGERIYLTNKFPLRERGNIYALCVVATDITEIKRAEYEVRDLTGHLLSAQDEERRRIARELHDSTVQNLTAIALNLDRLRKSPTLQENTRAIAEGSVALVKEIQSEIRTLSYVLHPPLLDEVGLAPALTWFVDGFSKRSGIDVRLQISPEIGRCEPDVEMAFFRIVQESLANVHRHSGSKTAEIRVSRTPAELTLAISDSGRGIIDEKAAGDGNQMRSMGVGIAGMRARLEQLGGKLDIRSGAGGGTTVTAILPLV